MSAIVCGVWKNASWFFSPEHIVALIDQAVVSGTSFVTTLLIARCSDSGQLGIYAVGISLLMSVVGFQESLILEPYLIQRHAPQGTPAEHVGAFLILSILLSAGSILLLTIFALGFLELSGGSKMVVMTFGIAGVLPFVLTREFARRVAFARAETRRALLLDVAVAVVQLSALSWLGASGRMTALSACAALGGASAIVVAGWLYYTRAEIAVRMRHGRTVFNQSWALGKWLLAGRITFQVQNYVTYWLLMAFAGAAVTGVYAACMSILAFANPLLLGLGNVLAPKVVLAWKNGGGPGLRHETIRNAVLVGTLMGAFSVAVLVAGEKMMHFLYPSAEYEGHGSTLTLLALATLAAAVGGPASFALATMARPRPIVVVGMMGAVLTVVLVWLMMISWGLLGVAYGCLAGSIVGAIGCWVAFLTRLPTVSEPTPVMLHDFAKLSDDNR